MDVDLRTLEDLLSPYLFLLKEHDVEQVSASLLEYLGTSEPQARQVLGDALRERDTAEPFLRVTVPGGDSLNLRCSLTSLNGVTVCACSPQSGAPVPISPRELGTFATLAVDVASHTVDGFVVIEKGRVVFANQRFADLVGGEADLIPGTHFVDYVSRSCHEEFIAVCAAASVGDGALIDLEEIVLTHACGRQLYLSLIAGWCVRGGRELLWLVLQDRTAERRLSQRLKEQNYRYAELFDHAPSGICYLTNQGRIEDCNAFVCSLVGRDREEIRGSDFTRYVTVRDVDALRESFGRLYDSGENIKGECVLEPGHGRRVVIDYTARLITRRGYRVGAIMLFSDITEQKAYENRLIEKTAETEKALWEVAEVKDALEARAGELNMIRAELEQANERLSRLSITDGLTELYNHRYFQDRLAEELERLERRKSSCVSLAMLDIDDFKKFNDTYGHQCGDMVLRQLARILREGVRKIDINARYGGEEFAVIFPDTPLDDARLVAERLCENVRSTPVTFDDGRSVKVTVSIGVATLTPGGGGKTDLVRMADSALYVAKAQWKDCVEIWEDEPL